MSQNKESLDKILRENCHTFEQLDQFISSRGIDQNHESVLQRRSDLVTELFLHDCENYIAVSGQCNSLDDYHALLRSGKINANDPAVLARLVDLTVSK